VDLSDCSDILREAAIRAVFNSGLSMQEIGKAAIISKIKEFAHYGTMTFGPGKGVAK